MHQHEREVNIIAEAIAHLRIDVICFREVGGLYARSDTTPYGESPSNMAFRIYNKLRHCGLFIIFFRTGVTSDLIVSGKTPPS
jgi:maltose 6'-phosphate phosphatase